MHEGSQPESTIEFSIVSAVYNVARYLDAFIESIESQSYPRERFEVIAVDDGSTDESLAVLRAWQARRPGLVTVVTKENGGQASARNVGIECARGRWITFTDPDDVLPPDYLSELAAFADEHPGVEYLAARLLVLSESTGALTDSHPLRRNFWHGNRVRNLWHYPDHFHSHASSAFFLLDNIRRQGLRFDTRIRPNFEDVHFCCNYLLALSEPIVAFVARAAYHYRTRADGTSTQQTSNRHHGRYSLVLRHGMLDLLRRAAQGTSTGLPPEWLQHLIVYQLSWYISSQEKHAAAPADVTDEFHDLVREILAFISEDVILGFSVRTLKPAWVDLLLHGYKPEPWHASTGHVAQLDSDQGLLKITYRFTGDLPTEELLSGGKVVPPAHAKTRDLRYHNRVLMRERIVWLSARQSVRVRLEGRDMDLQYELPRRRHMLRPGEIQRALGRRRARHTERHRKSIADRLIVRLARSRIVRRMYRNAWVFMDRISDAGDNAERLFTYLRAHRPEIPAWFVVEAGTPDWHRLRRAYGFRVVSHGSLRWKLLMANCRHLISSHVDVPIVEPPALAIFGKPEWRFTFLQHGVTKDDLSAWFNTKRIDILVTATPQEYAAMAGDSTPYALTTKEVKLTGFPRFDRLRATAAGVPADRRDLILVAPTWRTWLVPLVQPGTHRRSIGPDFFESDYVQNWLALLRSSELADACSDQRLTLAFLPHPNVQPALEQLNLPAHVHPLTFADNDVQELFARAAVFVTDYSSMAFDVAYIERPVVYFQFDADRVLGGEHLGPRSYFDYARDGFGPVSQTVEETVEAVVRIVRAGRSPAPTYLARMRGTFPYRDGKCCERVVAEIEASTQRLSASQAAVPTLAPPKP